MSGPFHSCADGFGIWEPDGDDYYTLADGDGNTMRIHRNALGDLAAITINRLGECQDLELSSFADGYRQGLEDGDRKNNPPAPIVRTHRGDDPIQAAEEKGHRTGYRVGYDDACREVFLSVTRAMGEHAGRRIRRKF